ncbi:MAG: sigma-70 family RNA polymerase sigma factor [Sphingomicrobium sp.]
MILDDQDCRRLMRKAQGGDGAAYRALLSACRDWLLRYYARRIAPQMVDDLVQDTLASLHSKRASFDVSRAFYPWLAAIARYRWIDALRKLTVAEELHEDTAAVESDEVAILSRLSLASLLSRLPPAQANVIALTKVEGRSIEETARICGQSAALVKVNVHRGLKKLAALVESE